MPKGKKNKGKFEHRRTEQAYSSDEDAGIDMTIDNCSETSGQSDLKSIHDEGDDIQEKFEEKVMEVIDALSARSNAARASALVSLRSALQRRHLTGILCNQRATLTDHVTKALRRGRDGEKRAAAGIAPLLALQIGEEGAEEFVREMRPALTATATDKSASIEARTECCSSLSVLCYLLEEDLTEIIEVMRVYETIFSGSYLKGDGSVKVSGAAVEEGALHAAALDGWALLLTLLAPAHAASLLAAQAPGPQRLTDLLEAASLEVRLSAGVALAMAHECVWESGALLPALEAAAPRLTQLARDSHKYRAKRDRKLQRATFRDVLKYFEDDEVPELSVRVGAETVECESWGSRAAYEALAAALGAGLQTLAPHCAALRAALGLTAAGPPLAPSKKLNKLQRDDEVPELSVRVGAETVECESWGSRAAYEALAAALGAGLQTLAPHCAALRAALGLTAAGPPMAPSKKLNKLQRHLQNNAACKARTLARNKNRDKRSAALAL